MFRKSILFFSSWQFILFFLFSSSVGAVEFRYFSVLAGAMRPVISSTDYYSNIGYLATISGSIGDQYVAQVNLPDGAEIVDVTCYGVDSDSDEFLFALTRSRFNGPGNNVTELITSPAYSNDTDGSSGVVSSAGTNPTPAGLNFINNLDFSYGLYLTLPEASNGVLYVIRFVVRAKIEDVSYFKAIEIK